MARTKLVTFVLAILALLAGCGPPSGTVNNGDQSTEGDENQREDERDDSAFEGGTWAPRGSLARLEDVPRAGLVEERPSRTGAVRLIALIPADGTGNHMVEIVGLPALDGQNVVASLRAIHDTPGWVGCNELTFIADGAPHEVDDARYEGGVTALGAQEAIQGRLPVSRLEAAASAQTLVVKTCENEYDLPDSPALLREFAERFAALVTEGDVASDTQSEVDSNEDAGADAIAPMR